MENKAFFEHILINDIHGLAAFPRDWTTESLFVCVIETHLRRVSTPPPKKKTKKQKKSLTHVCMSACAHFSNPCTCICRVAALPEFLLARQASLGGGRGAVAADGDERNLCAFVFPLFQK